MVMRRRGSVRFDPYFKAQRWDPRAMAWIDVQIPCATEPEARALFRPGARWRVMRIHEGGREPLEEEAP